MLSLQTSAAEICASRIPSSSHSIPPRAARDVSLCACFCSRSGTLLEIQSRCCSVVRLASNLDFLFSQQWRRWLLLRLLRQKLRSSERREIFQTPCLCIRSVRRSAVVFALLLLATAAASPSTCDMRFNGNANSSISMPGFVLQYRA